MRKIEFSAASRNAYRLQQGSERLCKALRKIADGAENAAEIARKALAHRAPDDFSALQQAFEAGVESVVDRLRSPSERMIKAGEQWQMHCSDVDTLFSEMIKAGIEEAE